MLNFLAQSYDYTTSYSTTSTAGSAAAGGFFLIFMLIILVLVVVSIVAMWKIFEKAGVEGWKAIIPVYNSWVLMEISGKPGWWALVSLVPYIGGLIFLVLYVMAMLELAKRFGKSQTFAIVGLVIFSFVGMLMLGFGKDKYTGSKFNTTGGSTPAATPPAAA